MIKFTLNGKQQKIAQDLDMPLLWFIRENAGLKGTKFGCGIGQCGACSVHINGQVSRSCSIPLSALDGLSITTIEGLSGDGEHPVQQAWKAIDVPQCGYCQSGQMMAAASLLADNPAPTDEDIDQNMTNICRCMTYVRIRKAVHKAAKLGKNVG
jgi:isoquinoline 1-oxidoreductase alpha subunit